MRFLPQAVVSSPLQYSTRSPYASDARSHAWSPAEPGFYVNVLHEKRWFAQTGSGQTERKWKENEKKSRFRAP